MNYLQKIINHKLQEVSNFKKNNSFKNFENEKYFHRNTFSLKSLFEKSNEAHIIAEFKRKSPSKGILNHSAAILDYTKSYQNAGASAISILTNAEFFDGKNEDIINVRDSIHIPILRKEFIVDELQIVESKGIGADLILLIAACLQPIQIFEFSKLAHSLNLEVLLEIHDSEELHGLNFDFIDFIGVNNRSLKSFEVNINHSIDMMPLLPKGIPYIAESAMNTVSDVSLLYSNGYNGFLIGEYFMRSNNPETELLNLKNKIYRK